MKKLVIFTFIFLSFNSYCQENSKLGLGSSFFNINENFDDLFIFNNSSPIYVSYTFSKKIRVENITNISLINENNKNTLVRGSLRFSADYLKNITSKVQLYFGPQIGINTSQIKLINLHIGGEYYFHKNWSISNQIGINYLFNKLSYLQTNSSVILRFYLNLKKN